MQKIILTLTAMFLIVGGLWVLKYIQPQKSETLSASAGLLKLDEELYDFGSISMADGKVNYKFKITNSGIDPLEMEKIYTSCMCTEATLIQGGKKYGPYGMPGHGFVPKVNRTLTPGEEAEILVEFDPTAHGPAGVGYIEREVIIEDNSGPIADFMIKATVTP